MSRNAAASQLELIPPPLQGAEETLQKARQAWQQVAELQPPIKMRKRDIALEIRHLQAQQARIGDESVVAEMDAKIVALEQEQEELQAQFDTLQVERTRLQRLVDTGQKAVDDLTQRAIVAYREWRQAHHVSEHSESARARYQSRIQASLSQRILENLIGEDETQAILYQNEVRPWMRRS